MEKIGGTQGRRLLVVANRLPVNVSILENGEIETKTASGGLVSGLQALSRSLEFRWFGWPGTDVHRNDRKQVKRELAKRNAYPVFLGKDLVENHYNGFSNSVLWPLLHGMPFRAQFDENWTEAYSRVNEDFANTIAPCVEDGDSIWIHDYHLLLLPRMLRDRLQKKKNVRIGLFLHTPFPNEDAFAILPLREAICDGLLSCDLMGFHIREYVDIFLNSAETVLSGVRRTPSDLHYHERKLIAKEFPIGIDPEEFKASIASEATQTQKAKLQENFKGKKIILGVDRLDYIKGIPQKLHAFDKMLKENPKWIGKVVLVQLCVPTRSTVHEYKVLRKEVEELVGRINGNHGTLMWTPIQYLHMSLEKATLHALYAVSDVCVVSSIQDGLNLVSYEYVASQTERTGVLMLSQYTGAARLLKSAIHFNPWDAPRFSEAIEQALEMSQEERKSRLDSATDIVANWTSTRWGLSFLDALQSSEIDED